MFIAKKEKQTNFRIVDTRSSAEETNPIMLMWDKDANFHPNEVYIRDAQGNMMATYQVTDNTLTWKEQFVYGSS